SIIVFNLV
nr:Chain P, DPATG1 antigen SIIVFNLV [Mus musculus]